MTAVNIRSIWLRSFEAETCDRRKDKNCPASKKKKNDRLNFLSNNNKWNLNFNILKLNLNHNPLKKNGLKVVGK